MNITLEEGPFGTFILAAEDGRSILVQTDLDFPGTASHFGFKPCLRCATDGTVDCWHRAAIDMITDAREFLDAHIGESIEDPGYFS